MKNKQKFIEFMSSIVDEDIINDNKADNLKEKYQVIIDTIRKEHWDEAVYDFVAMIGLQQFINWREFERNFQERREIQGHKQSFDNVLNFVKENWL